MARDGDGLLCCPKHLEKSRSELTEENLVRTPEPAEEHPDGGAPVKWYRPAADDRVDCAYRDVGTTPTLPVIPMTIKVTF
jgi:hypothetical protein